MRHSQASLATNAHSNRSEAGEPHRDISLGAVTRSALLCFVDVWCRAERSFWELPGKVFDIAAFGTIAVSDALPAGVRLYFQRYFLPVFILLFLCVIYPRLYFNLDGDRGARVMEFRVGATHIANTTIACQMLLNMSVFFAYIIYCSYKSSQAFTLVTVRVRVVAASDPRRFVHTTTSRQSRNRDSSGQGTSLQQCLLASDDDIAKKDDPAIATALGP